MATATARKTTLKIFPLADRVAIRPMEETETMKGGLYIPDTAKEKPIQGEVISVGPGRREKGEAVPMELRVGDRVVYGKYSGTQIELDNEEIILIKEADVIATLASAFFRRKHRPGSQVSGLQHRGPGPPEARRGSAGRCGEGDARPQGAECRHRQEVRQPD